MRAEDGGTADVDEGWEEAWEEVDQAMRCDVQGIGMHMPAPHPVLVVLTGGEQSAEAPSAV